MDAFLDNLTQSGSSVAYTSTELLKQQTASIQSIVLLVGGMIAAIFVLTVLKSALNLPSMWFFTLNFTLAPVFIAALIYVLLAAAIPAIIRGH